ncbi:ABC transporter substrate-binding protein [Alcaligenaceae bacterium A4P071]|nr:ABC transporter substrate-binding protein [Alcaligenaceae bacterium A4P071]
MQRRSLIKMLFAGVAAPLGLTACEPSDRVAVAAAPGGSAAAKILTIAQGNDILSLDPADHGNNSTEASLVNLYDYLIDKDFSSGELVFTPALAQSWKAETPQRWIFTLRRDVTWHDGAPFTARDVKFTIERTLADKKLRSNAKFRGIVQVTAADDHTVVIETDAPDTLLLHKFVGNGAAILPAAAFQKAGGKEAFFKQPIGTGPYRYNAWIKADRLVLDRNPNWWGGTPAWDQVVVRAIPETTTRVSEFITGGVDIAVNVPPEDIARIKANTGTDVVAFDIARNLALHVRTGKDWPTSHPKIREAIDLAIDREALAKQVVEGYARPTRGFFPKAIPGYAASLDAPLPYDPARARALLTEAGFPDGVKIRLSSPSGRYVKDREISEAVAGYLQEAGFTVQLEILDWTVYNTKVTSDTFGELYLWGMGSYTDGSVLFRDKFDRHYDWVDPAFERLGVQARNATDEAQRVALIRDGQTLLAEQRVRIGLLYPQSIYGISDRIRFAGRFDEMIPAEAVSLA